MNNKLFYTTWMEFVVYMFVSLDLAYLLDVVIVSILSEFPDKFINLT